MIDKKKEKLNMKVQWMKFIVVLVLYLLFLYWVKSWLGLVVIPFIYDIYITKKIRWQWWQDAEGPVRFIMSWVDALVFALVAVYFINQFLFQNFVIPSSSLEKSLLTGDYLCVSKVSYGPRIPQTPLTMPLTQHTLPIIGCKSYIEWPHWDYRRVKGLGDVQLNDIVVFNFPAGDTICYEPQYQQDDYYRLCYLHGKDEYLKQKFNFEFSGPEDQLHKSFVQKTRLDSLNKIEQRKIFEEVFALGSRFLRNNPNIFGDITARPTDRRENYVKRCVGLPGQTLQIKDHIIYLDGKANKEPEDVQYTYRVVLQDGVNSYDLEFSYDDMLKDLCISREDLAGLNSDRGIPLTKRAVKELLSHKELVKSITLNTQATVGETYPLNAVTGWTRDNYGPVWIPKKGESIDLTIDNIAVYERPIRIYEGNDLEVKNGQIYINGQLAKSYTFKLDYYWMMGDNRHNSLDSRYWGFVPEDHIVGKPLFVWWSSDPDRHGFKGIRWNRIGKVVDDIK